MKVRIEMEIDLDSGDYDVRFHNLTSPGENVETARLPNLVFRVLENVAREQERTEKVVEPPSGKRQIN